MMPNSALQNLFETELRQIHDSEKQILMAMPGIVRKATNRTLRAVLESHLQDAGEQVQRLEQIFELLYMGPVYLSAKTPASTVMDAILNDADAMFDQAMKVQPGEPAALDAACIAVARQIVHHKIAAYGTLRTWCSILDHPAEVVALLGESELEEKTADTELSELNLSPRSVRDHAA